MQLCTLAVTSCLYSYGWVGIENFIISRVFFFNSGVLSWSMAVYSFGLAPFLSSAKTGGLSFISGCFHINVVSNLDACCFLILSPGGLAVPCSPSPRAWHQHIPAAQSQGARVTQTALQTRRRRAARVTVKPTTLTLRECQLLR